jgi:hypothetical protein
MAPLVPASFGKYTARKHNAMPIEARRCFTGARIAVQNRGLYFSSWFVSKVKFFTNP